jgi:hypothetical protein
LAGSFGLLGAVIGGAAAVWGARQQVRGQAAAEHHHWSRQMRREAYEGFVTGATEVINSFMAFRRALSDGGHEAARDDVKHKLHALLYLGTRVTLAGPEDMNALAHQLSSALHSAGQRLMAIDSVDALAAADDLDPLLVAAGREGDKFTMAARLELQRPPR